MSGYSSKFHHIYGEAAKGKNQYSGIKNALTSGESQYIKANDKFFAYGTTAGGGPVYIRKLSDVGRTKPGVKYISTHKGRLTDFDFHPFINTLIATGADDCKVNISQFPSDGLSETINKPVMELKGHRNKISLIKFNRVANNIIASASYDRTVKVFNIENAAILSNYDQFKDNIYSIEWNKDGSMLATTCKDKIIRVYDPRKPDEAMIIPGAFGGIKATKCYFVNAFGWIGSTGFSKSAKRENKMWDLRNIEKPIYNQGIDNAASVLIPHVDDDLNMLYLAGKGDNSVSYYELRNDDKMMYYLSLYRDGTPQKGGGWVFKRGLDVMKCEVQRYLKLTKDSVVPISFVVPRKSGGDVFQEDIYPPCASNKPAESADDWNAGNNAEPKTMSMDPDDRKNEGDGDDYEFKCKATYEEVVQENVELKKKNKQLEDEIAQLKGKLSEIRQQHEHKNDTSDMAVMKQMGPPKFCIRTIKFKDVNFGIFDNDRETCAISGNYTQDDIINHCSCIQRVIAALKYYEYLDISNSEDARSAFTEFVALNYKHYLDDIIHLTTKHEKHLESINNALLKEAYFQCDIDQCQLTARHCRSNDKGKLTDIDMDRHFLFYQDTFDTVHYYLLHLFEMGLRIQQGNNILDDIDEKGTHFLTKKLFISSKRKKLAHFFARFSTKNEPNKLQKQTSKFKLQSVVDTEDDETFMMDALYELLHSLKCKKIANDDEINRLKNYLEAEEFTTDSLMDDIYSTRIHQKSSNVLKIIQNEKIIKEIFLFIQEHKLRSSAFSTGFIFWYWPYYRNCAENNKYKDYDYWNYNDFGGYTTVELYVKCGKYRNLKEEILTNEDNEIGINKFQDMVVITAQEYIETKRVKNIMAKGGDEGVTLHYDIPEFEPLHEAHLQSIILYCDFSQLCTNFSKTFRRIRANESLESVKNRNVSYWWLSKLLRETVQKYGNNGVHKSKNRQRLSVQARSCDQEFETGPFFCGMDKVMVVDSFATRLCGPASTTTQFQIARNFAEQNGMILQFNNKYVDGGKHLRFFDSSWISRYKEEAERIFIGGTHLLQVESILHTSTMLNFSKFFNALYWFNAVLDGGRLFGMKNEKSGFTKKDLKIIQSLVSQNNSRISDYILETFSVFTLSKTTIVMNMDNISRQCPLFLTNFMFNQFDGGMRDKETIVYSDLKTNSNLLTPKLLNTFAAMTNIVIYCTDNIGHKSYRFSLNRLLTYLSMLSSVKREKIKCTLNAVWKTTPKKSNNYAEKRSWLFFTYSKMSSKQLQSDIFSSSLVATRDPYFGNKQDTLTFECLSV